MNICIPTLNASDDLWACIGSIQQSSIYCDIYVIDNGGIVVAPQEGSLHIYRPSANLGVAGSWNWFIDNVPEPRIITNDDIVFDRNAIEILQRAEDANHFMIVPENLESHYSCFLLPDRVVEVVGRFDEWISPKYAYFEDDDYSYRMGLAGLGVVRATGAFVEHVGSSTMKHMNPMQRKEHHDRFRLARDHYKKKWGGGPHEEQFRTPFNK